MMDFQIKDNFLFCGKSSGNGENWTGSFVKIKDIKSIHVTDSIEHCIIYTYTYEWYVVNQNINAFIDDLNKALNKIKE